MVDCGSCFFKIAYKCNDDVDNEDYDDFCSNKEEDDKDNALMR